MKAFSHFKTITHHKILVMQGCFKVGLYRQGLLHDMSKYSPARMPEKYVVEMLMDRIAACKTYHGSSYTDGDPLAYFSKGKTNAMIHPKTKALLENLLTMLAQEGEDKTFSYIRREIFHKKR